MLKDFIDFNPRETLPKGQLAKKVAMEKLRPFCRDIEEFEVAKYSGGAKFRNGDTLLARITPCLENGKTAQVRFLNDGEVGFGSTEYIVLRAKEGVSDSDYIYYLSTSPKLRDIAIQSMVGSSGRQRVQQDVLEKAELHIPPLDEQKKIAGILSALDDKIELNNKINRNLEAQAQAIFKSWFVDFEPFKNGKFIDSELGKIPEYWQVVKFSEFLKPRIEKINNSTITEYSVTNSGIFKRDEKFKKRLSGAKTFNKIIYYADMVFGMSREILNWGLMRDQIGSVSSAYTVFSVNTELVDLSYLEFFMRYHHEYFKSLIRLASREGQGIDKAVLFNKCVIIPDTNAIARFLEILNSISNSRLAINEESRRLVQLRDALLPKLMSGEIDVANVAV